MLLLSGLDSEHKANMAKLRTKSGKKPKIICLIYSFTKLNLEMEDQGNGAVNILRADSSVIDRSHDGHYTCSSARI